MNLFYAVHQVMRARRLLRDTLIIAFNTVVLLAVVEGGLRAAYFVRNSTVDVVVLPYTAAQDWGVLPPWIDALRILEPDPVLLWKNTPGVERTYLDVYGPARVEADRVALLQQFIPRMPESLRSNPVWRVSINAQGFRGPDFAREKPPATFRIVCIGDSWTFGANVDQPDTYPQRLAEILGRRYPGVKFEVLNLGVMGYSSRQGLELLQRNLAGLQTDLLLIGFGMNDAIVQGWRDKDGFGQPQTARLSLRWADHLESYRLARVLAGANAPPAVDHRRLSAARGRGGRHAGRRLDRPAGERIVPTTMPSKRSRGSHPGTTKRTSRR